MHNSHYTHSLIHTHRHIAVTRQNIVQQITLQTCTYKLIVPAVSSPSCNTPTTHEPTNQPANRRKPTQTHQSAITQPPHMSVTHRSTSTHHTRNTTHSSKHYSPAHPNMCTHTEPPFGTSTHIRTSCIVHNTHYTHSLIHTHSRIAVTRHNIVQHISLQTCTYSLIVPIVSSPSCNTSTTHQPTNQRKPTQKHQSAITQPPHMSVTHRST